MANQRAQIFIGYRRRDSQGFAGRLADDLIECFGTEQVFRDDEITEGSDYTQVLDAALSSCDVLMVVIGPQWVHATNAEGQRRLLNPEDWVRREVEVALERGVWILPVLVGSASMPTINELPSELSAVTRIQAFDMSDRSWDEDLERLVGLLTDRIPALSVAPGIARHPGSTSALPSVLVDALNSALNRRANATTRSSRYARRIRASAIRLLWLALVALLAWFLFENHASPEFQQGVVDFIAFVREKFAIVIAQVGQLPERQ